MRKCVATILIVIYLFNLAGYSWLFDYLSYRHTIHTVKQLDANSYKESDLIEMKVPLYLPYFQSWPDYERYDGEIELNGIYYNFVKRKVVNDTLYMLCLPDYWKTGMISEKNRFIASNTDDQPSSSKQKHDPGGKKGGADHNSPPAPIIYLGFIQLRITQAVYAVPLPSCYIGLLTKPPEVTG